MVAGTRPLDGKVAVVTGGGAGLGLGIAEAFVEAGATVVVADVSADAATDVARRLSADGGKAVAIATDVTRRSDVEALFDEVARAIGPPDILVNNAGIVVNRPAVDITEDDFDRIVAVNLKGVVFCSQAAAKLMIPAGGGRIINIASSAARAAAPGYCLYSATKSAVQALTRALAVEWAPHGILVNAISPGVIDTPLTQGLRARDPAFFARRDRRVPLARAGQPHDVGRVALFLATQASDYITGHDILIDGGLFAQHPGYVP
jgi:NAD(P)-dependent dehydrogenase (short-subunit alcohol dehydrogenase family)